MYMICQSPISIHYYLNGHTNNNNFVANKIISVKEGYTYYVITLPNMNRAHLSTC
jgi:hypothetical protein